MKRSVFILLVLSMMSAAAFAQDFIGKGKVSLSTRDTAGAIQAFKDALRANQKAGDANYYLGAISYAQGRVDEAKEYLLKAVDINDDNADALTLLAQIHLLKKDVPAALGVFKKAIKSAPKNAALAVGYGKTLLGADSIDAAILQLTRAKELDESNPEIYAMLAEAYLKQGVAPLGISNFQKAIELAPKQISYVARLAQIYEKNRQYTEAVGLYEKVASADTNNAEPYLSIGQILIRASGSQKKLAIAPLEKYVAKKPASVEGAALLSKALFQIEDWNKLVPAAKRALELDARNPDLWRQSAYALAETKDYKGAVTAFEKLKELKAFKPEDQTKYGNSLVGVGREEDAMNSLLEAVRLDSTNCDPYFNLGSLYMKKQDWANASKMFEKKIACDPKSVKSLSSYLNGAACYMQLKNWERTRALLEKALEIYPDFLQARLWFARYFIQVDSLDRAKEQYDAVLQGASQNPDKYKREIGEAHAMSGSYYFTTQKFASAIESFRKAVATGNESAGLQLSWGQAVLQTLDASAPADEGKKKKEEAMTHFRRSIAIDGKNPVSHLWLAQTLILLRVEGADEANKKLQEEACQEYKQVLRLQPTNADAKKGMERIGCK
jgi:tetratricopeptide (TPR) repeat protein